MKDTQSLDFYYKTCKLFTCDYKFTATKAPAFGYEIGKSTRGFDDPVLIGLGSIAMARTVCEPLHHFRPLSLCVLEVRVTE